MVTTRGEALINALVIETINRESSLPSIHIQFSLFNVLVVLGKDDAFFRSPKTYVYFPYVLCILILCFK
jgi:hypothetical protein